MKFISVAKKKKILYINFFYNVAKKKYYIFIFFVKDNDKV